MIDDDDMMDRDRDGDGFQCEIDGEIKHLYWCAKDHEYHAHKQWSEAKSLAENQLLGKQCPETEQKIHKNKEKFFLLKSEWKALKKSSKV